MRTSSYDIFRRDALGTITWIEAVPDVGAAKARILHLAERFPAEYLIFHQASASVVANFNFKPTEFHAVTSPMAEESLSSS